MFEMKTIIYVCTFMFVYLLNKKFFFVNLRNKIITKIKYFNGDF